MRGSKGKLYLGTGMLAAFLVVLVLFFMPLYAGMNGLDYLDNLYNSISKGSAYYIPKVKDEVAPYAGQPVSVTLKLDSPEMAEQTRSLFAAAGAQVAAAGSQLKVSGDLGQILQNALTDSDFMYRNEGQQVSGKYGYDEKRVLYHWWKAFHEMDKDLSKQKKFKEAKAVALVVKKAVESSYNYYQIEPRRIGDRWGTVFFSLVFYVIYTLWYGFAILFMFEGSGLRLEH